MIVRINQLDLSRAEDESGWPARGMLAGIRHAWPSDARAYEVLILERDEQQQALTESFRRQQLRQLIPEAIAALQESDEEAVVRLAHHPDPVNRTFDLSIPIPNAIVATMVSTWSLMKAS